MIPSSSGSLQLVRLFGIPIRVHFTFLVLVAVVAVVAAQGGYPAPTVLLALLLVVASAVLHELGHALVARGFGFETREIVLYPIGGMARLSGMPSGLAELGIAAAGPAVNLVLVILLALVAAVTGTQLDPFGGSFDLTNGMPALLSFLVLVNGLLFALNLVPAFPMDGGRILRAALTFLLPEAQATRIAALVGQGLALALALYALVVPGGLLLLLVAVFVFVLASQEAVFSRTLTLVHGRRASEAMMSRVATLAPTDTIGYAARWMLAGSQRDFPVVDAWGRVAGLLDRASILATVGVGRDAAVLQVMRREVETVSTDTPLEEVLRRLMKQPGLPVLVTEGDQFRGVISWEKLHTFLDLVQRV